jgi:peroxiredoxin
MKKKDKMGRFYLWSRPMPNNVLIYNIMLNESKTAPLSLEIFQKICLYALVVFLIIVAFNSDDVLAVQVGSVASDFELSGLDNKKMRLSDLKGKVVVVNFWASWCRECIEELPSLQRLYEAKIKENIAVIGVSIDRSEAIARQTAQKAGITFPVLLDKNGEIFIGRYAIIGLPTTLIIDKRGIIKEIIKGQFDYSSPLMVEKIESILKERR